jgi:4-hydroxythreonine-4-phosphate dehydrogenase
MSPVKKSFKRILVTTGDADGVGFEVTAKALLTICRECLVKDVQFIVFRSAQALLPFEKRLLVQLKKAFTTQELFSSEASLDTSVVDPSKSLILIYSSQAPAQWVEQAARACLNKSASALVTGPLSKPEIHQSGYSDLGHTDILKRICQVSSANMCFLGRHFNVVLATGHLPLKQAPDALTESVLVQTLERAHQLYPFLPSKIARRPLGVLGLNPHAGDQGLIGDFEQKTLTPLLKKMRGRGIPVEGPLVPDVAFHSSSWSKYSFYVSLYHDQGLIPFKMAHGFDSGVHLTLGLPIWRTSVDHGTAKDIFGRNKANSGSMQEALRWAAQFCP